MRTRPRQALCSSAAGRGRGRGSVMGCRLQMFINRLVKHYRSLAFDIPFSGCTSITWSDGPPPTQFPCLAWPDTPDTPGLLKGFRGTAPKVSGVTLSLTTEQHTNTLTHTLTLTHSHAALKIAPHTPNLRRSNVSVSTSQLPPFPCVAAVLMLRQCMSRK